MKNLRAFVLLLCCTGILQAQESIHFKNPSFEDHPHINRTPKEWVDCGFPGESPPDTYPSGDYDVTKNAYDGRTYLGLVTRDNDTWEAVSQQLSSPLERGQCYRFSIFLARSPVLNSVSRKSPERHDAKYITPVVFRIWGGRSPCDKQELLAVTEPIKSVDWEEYFFNLSPTNDDVTHLLFEVYYSDQYGASYNGNLLLDKASMMEPIDCRLTSDSLQMINQVENDKQRREALLKKIIIPESIDPDLFWEWAWEYGPQIKFTAHGGLATELYSDENGKVLDGNIYLHYLALAAQQLSGSQLQIYVHGHDAGLLKTRKTALQQALYNWGFINERIKVFSVVGELTDPPKDLPENALFFADEVLGFYFIP